jgi:hypothetical protein
VTATRRVLVVLGGLAIAYAVVGAVTGDSFHPVGTAAFLSAVLVAHDGLVLPAAIALGLVLTGRRSARVRGPVTAGLYASLVVTLVALPFVLGRGRSTDNPSALPRNYPVGWIWLLVAIWVTVAAALGWRRLTRRRPAATPARKGAGRPIGD